MNLLHQPGSGGTTLAKQVLWDMRKTLRCAVLTGATSDITAIAKQVIHLFTAGGQGQQNTVLLLLEDERILENLQDAIIKEIAERNITTHMPVVIILNCVLNGVVRQHRVFARVDGKEIEVCAEQRRKVWKSEDVCFYLGFTIRGPVAYGIQYPSHHGHVFYSGPVRSCTTCANVMESTNWVQVEPVAITKEAPMFSTSPPGRYECRVSGLRWVCKDHVSLQYQFSSWEPHRAMMKSLGYKQGGPLLDVTVISGELEEVQLPHFACFGDDPSFKEKVRVLHVEDCGVSIEQVDEVTRFHVKILHPSFSPKGVLVRSGFPVKAHCDLLLYQAKTAFLTLHAYLVPCDSSVEQNVQVGEDIGN
ncbi:NACHT, LRR and PYD domains-containing protein 1 homolog [Salvelinus namaycush]|uniref:NACHT, LRR and PYD domains-containing protein 1 homolog n=1 Tax=Salvelinus namaycush TaxID=8040 RepID=A0A8U0PVS3_SALNM|nr:NACHT, LRR and PYD domains-containing protein 1 homolog [Salvelinus namaycush]